MQVQVAVDVVEGQAGGAEPLKLRVDLPPQRFAQTVLKEIPKAGAGRVLREFAVCIDQSGNLFGRQCRMATQQCQMQSHAQRRVLAGEGHGFPGLVDQLVAFPKPLICAVNGTCVGGGHHFVVDADIVIASRNAKFIDAHVNVGMVGAIENIGLAKRLPLGTALRMTLLGNSYSLSSERAFHLGLVDELVETPDDARALAQEMARQMLQNSPQAMALSKRAVWGSLEQGYEQSANRSVCINWPIKPEDRT
jgi:enoyl-CoA hydratase/carnithine racemase